MSEPEKSSEQEMKVLYAGLGLPGSSDVTMAAYERLRYLESRYAEAVRLLRDDVKELASAAIEFGASEPLSAEEEKAEEDMRQRRAVLDAFLAGEPHE